MIVLVSDVCTVFACFSIIYLKCDHTNDDLRAKIVLAARHSAIRAVWLPSVVKCGYEEQLFLRDIVEEYL